MKSFYIPTQIKYLLKVKKHESGKKIVKEAEKKIGKLERSVAKRRKLYS